MTNPTPPPFIKHVVGCAHSVVTAHLIDAVGEPTVTARDEILRFFAARLGPQPQPVGIDTNPNDAVAR